MLYVDTRAIVTPIVALIVALLSSGDITPMVCLRVIPRQK